MSSDKWRKLKLALGLGHCVLHPTTTVHDHDDPSSSDDLTGYTSAASTPKIGSFRPRFSRSASGSSKKICSICLGNMKPGQGRALFTAECSHTFHFHCIASNVKHGNHICPICRAKWKEVPFQGSGSSDQSQGRPPANLPQEDDFTVVIPRLLRSGSTNLQHHLRSIFNITEPSSFDDDEPLQEQSEPVMNIDRECTGTVETKIYPEFSVISPFTSPEKFDILIHLKAPMSSSRQTAGPNHPANVVVQEPYRAPLDLVTVLDVSGSMLGTKLALLKRAMGFVIQNLGPSDRLSVVVFSSTARRLFHLRAMSESGRQQALEAVNSLVSSGGTNIADGLRKGAKVIEERKEKNPVCSIILLSDGQDTYMLPPNSGDSQLSQADYKGFLPSSIQSGMGHQIPVHAFGFGSDHDSFCMHSISEISGGTFSFIESESVIQDAFAQCIGGLLSVVVQELSLDFECAHPDVRINSVKCGSYTSCIADDKTSGSIDVGDLYADEERDFLISVNVPAIPQSCNETVLLKVGLVYEDPISKESVKHDKIEVKVQRSEVVADSVLSIEVDRQRNRIQAAEAIVEARMAAERGMLSEAVGTLDNCRKSLVDSLAGRTGDRLCVALDAELREMQERMTNQKKYEASGRAYVLSGLSSHSWQRATARGDSTNSTSLVQSYQTRSMVDMLQRSQTFSPATQQPKLPIHPSRSFAERPGSGS